PRHRSRSEPRRCRRAKCRSSGRWRAADWSWVPLGNRSRTSSRTCPQTCSRSPSSCMVRQPRGKPTRVRPYAQTTGCPMATYKSDFLNVLNERGFIHQCSDFPGLDALAVKGEVVAYVGYDCTAPSLHIGNLYTMMMLHWLQQTGAGKPI